ncbi:MAG: tyrosine-type recombinase/integrase [Steroidobacteraceae bacterium]
MSALAQLFVRLHRRYDQDRYADDLERFAAWLLANDFSIHTAQTHLFRVQQVLRAVAVEPGTTLGLQMLRRAFRRLERRDWKYRHTRSTYLRYLRATGRLVETPPPPPPDPLESSVREFCQRLERQRGLTRSTVAGYYRSICDFLRWALPHSRSLGELTPNSLESYIDTRSPKFAPRTFRCAIRSIQAFLHDCYDRGQLAERLDLIDLPRGFRPERPPRALPWPFVEQLLESIDRTRRTGSRDHAMLHLMACYGLRTGELTELTLDSINWQRRTLTVWRAKTRSTTVLPLHGRTLGILSDYLKSGRPQAKLSYLFLTDCAPRAAITSSCVARMFGRRLQSSLTISGYSPYSLRHAFAMRLFQRGVGMKAIGDLMGHRDLVSTSVYLRLQSETLREVALPVPRPAPQAEGLA